MVLYGTQSWIHLSSGRPDRWFRWSILEFICDLFSLYRGTALGTYRNGDRLERFILGLDLPCDLLRGKTHLARIGFLSFLPPGGMFCLRCLPVQ